MKKNILPVEQSREYLLSMLGKGTKPAADTGGTDTASGGYGAARSKKQKVAALIRPELTIPAGAETDADSGGYWDEEADARYDAFLKDYEKTAVPAGAETDARTDGEGDPLSGEQKLDAKIAAKLPESFPVDEWETLTTKQQLKAMQFSGLTNEEQWRLLNASMPLKELASIGGWESDSDDTGTDSSKITPLQQRILDRQLEKEEEAMRSVLEQGISGEGDGTLFDWSTVGDTSGRQSLPFPAPVPVIRGVPYPENGQKAYVFYTNRPKGWYKRQAKYQKKILESLGYEVEIVCTNNVDDFSEAWNMMDPKTTTAVIISHSNGMSLIFEEGSPTNAISAIGKNIENDLIPAIGSLSGPEIANLYIYACNAGHEELLAQAGTNVADAFRDLANVDTVYAFDGSVGFGPSALVRPDYQPRLSNKQNYDTVFSNFKIPDTLGKSGPSGFLEYDSDDKE
jgi:hypothetical protein